MFTKKGGHHAPGFESHTGTGDSASCAKASPACYTTRRPLRLSQRGRANNDAAEREAILAALAEAMHRGDKSLIGNRGYRRFLKLKSGRRFEIDPQRIALDALFDGIYVLQRCILRPEQHLSRAGELLELLEQEPNDTADALVGVDLVCPISFQQ